MTDAAPLALSQLKTPPHMINKPILKSKTFWVQVLAVLAVLFPAVQEWLAANPVEFVAVLAAINVIVRFVTSGKISILGDTDQVHGFPWFLFAVGTAVAAGTLLPSCSPAQMEAARKLPIRGAVTYDAEAGLGFRAEASGK